MKISQFSKKQLKDFVNENGFFNTVLITEKNAPNDEGKPEGVPEGATFFKGIASTGELNRNGYIISVEAWKGAIAGFMENPVILLQHDTNQPIGNVLTAEVTDEGLVVTGYIFDDLTGNRFSRGLINALSTGHLTLERKFKNEVTGEILDEEAFQKLNWEEQGQDYWVMVVTGLEWLELSAVSIGSNRKSLVSSRELMKNYVESIKNSQEPIEGEDTEPENAGETPEVSEEAKAENAEVEPETVAEPEKVIDVEGNAMAETFYREVVRLREQNAQLEAKLNSTPVPKGIVNAIKSQPETAQKESWLKPILENNGLL